MPRFFKMNFWFPLMIVTVLEKVLKLLPVKLSLICRQTLHLQITRHTEM